MSTNESLLNTSYGSCLTLSACHSGPILCTCNSRVPHLSLCLTLRVQNANSSNFMLNDQSPSCDWAKVGEKLEYQPMKARFHEINVKVSAVDFYSLEWWVREGLFYLKRRFGQIRALEFPLESVRRGRRRDPTTLLHSPTCFPAEICRIRIEALLTFPLKFSWMGQSGSTVLIQGRRENADDLRLKMKSAFPVSSMRLEADSMEEIDDGVSDYISNLPDECLACIFQYLGSADRKRSSLVCRRWLRIEGQSRYRLSLNAESDLVLRIPSIFSRFDAVTKLALKCDRKSMSIGDDALVLISLGCLNLTRLKLRACRELTDAGMAAFGKNCKGLKKLSCGSCTFGAKGMNAVLDNCPALEEISVKRLRGITESAAELIGPGVAASSLKTICLKELYNGQCFGPLIVGAKNLRTLKLFRCSGDWDKLLQVIGDRGTALVEIHLERLQVSDLGLAAISNCGDLEILHLVKTPECTNLGLVSVAERCKLLRKLHIDGWKANRIGDEGLVAVAKTCLNLKELVLIGVNPTKVSLEILASNCQNLERLALCASDTVGDAEISCIAAKCMALKKLCIKSCPVSDHGMEAIAEGCPNLVKVKVKKCRGVTPEGADMLRASRGSLTVNLDTGECDHQEANASDGGGAQDNAVELPPVPNQDPAPFIASSNSRRSPSLKSRLGRLSGKSLVASTLRRWSGGHTGSTSN